MEDFGFRTSSGPLFGRRSRFAGCSTPSFASSDKDEAYLDMHLIPTDKELWKLDRFEDFIAARKELIRTKFKNLLV
jgi:hypothetical protein